MLSTARILNHPAARDEGDGDLGRGARQTRKRNFAAQRLRARDRFRTGSDRAGVSEAVIDG